MSNKKSKNNRNSKKTQKKGEYQFETGLAPIDDWTQPSPFICGSCYARVYPQRTYSGECTKCKYKILYKARPRYEVTHKAR